MRIISAIINLNNKYPVAYIPNCFLISREWFFLVYFIENVFDSLTFRGASIKKSTRIIFAQEYNCMSKMTVIDAREIQSSNNKQKCCKTVNKTCHQKRNTSVYKSSA